MNVRFVADIENLVLLNLLNQMDSKVAIVLLLLIRCYILYTDVKKKRLI